MQPLGEVRRTQLWEQVAAELRRAIVLGEFGPDEHLIETNLAANMRVSRGPVREALRQLEREALVRVNPNGRTLVVGLSPAGIEQTYDTRLCLESYALELAAARVTDEDIVGLQGLLDAATGAGPESTNALLNELDLRFHRSFFVIGGNQVLLRLWETLSPQIQTLLEITNVVNTRKQSIATKHQRIVDALAAKDAAASIAHLTSHLEEAREVLLHRMAEVSLAESAPTPAAREGVRGDTQRL